MIPTEIAKKILEPVRYNIPNNAYSSILLELQRANRNLLTHDVKVSSSKPNSGFGFLVCSKCKCSFNFVFESISGGEFYQEIDDLIRYAYIFYNFDRIISKNPITCKEMIMKLALE